MAYIKKAYQTDYDWYRPRIWLVMASLCTASVYAGDEPTVVDLPPGTSIPLEAHTNHQVNIDGHLDEPIWSTLAAYDEFVVIEPDTLADTPYATMVRFFYDQTGLYIGVAMQQPQDTLISRLSGRDMRWLSRDSINLTLDTSGEGRYGYWFGVGLGGSLMDGTLLPERQFSSDWDGAWRAASQVTAQGWSGEFHIPWGLVAMPKVSGKRRIGLYMSRKVAHLNERWGWPGLPSTVPKFISALQGLEVTGIDPQQEFSIYPFTAVANNRIDNQMYYRSGVDFFWRPSTNFQLSATVNPDFGAVESDDVVTNLTATETFFPEKRLFFLEGQEIFVATPRANTRGSGLGHRGSPTTLINTRRIGGKPMKPPVASDVVIPEQELLQPADLVGAVKLTGQAGRLRYGVLGAFEDDVNFHAMQQQEPIRVKGYTSNYGIARILYEDAPGGAYRAFGVMSTATLNHLGNAKTHGVDGHYLRGDGALKIDGQIFMSDIEDEETGFGGFVDFEYTFRKGLSQRLGIAYFDRHVDINHLGYQSRQDSFRIRSSHIRTSSDISWARNNEFDVRGFVQQNAAGLFTSGGLLLSNRTTFHNLSRLTVRSGFFPQSYDDLNSFGNGAYRIEDRRDISFGWGSDSSKDFSYGMNIGWQTEHLGGHTWRSGLNMFWRPGERFGLSGSVRYVSRKGWLLHQEDDNFTTFQAEQWVPRISADYFINAHQQFRFSFQWVGIKAAEYAFYKIPTRPGALIPVAKPSGPSDSFSLSQMSLQLRYRWEIAPLSDLFFVYTRVVDASARLKSFRDTFSDSYDQPLVDVLVLKLRYRFGS